MKYLLLFINWYEVTTQVCKPNLSHEVMYLTKAATKPSKKKKKTAENISDITKAAPTSLIPDQTCCPKIRNLFKFFPPSGNIVAEMVKFIF